MSCSNSRAGTPDVIPLGAEFGEKNVIVRPGRVTLPIYRVDGSLVRRLVDEDKPPGQYQTEWNDRNDSGTRVSSGVYFYRLSVGTTVLSRSMTLLK